MVPAKRGERAKGGALGRSEKVTVLADAPGQGVDALGGRGLGPLGLVEEHEERERDALEDELGAPLFLRNPKGYVLTELGVDLLKVAQKTDDLFEDLAGRARGHDGSITGDIKITSIPNFMNLLMKPVASLMSMTSELISVAATMSSSSPMRRLDPAAQAFT